MWVHLVEDLGIERDIVERLKLLYIDLKVRLSEDIENMYGCVEINIGVKQGCPISPILFCIIFD
jgi:hypothetical protein